MSKLVSFFEIPAVNFERAVSFYQSVLGLSLTVYECEQEKMAFFPEEDGQCPGAISWSSEIRFAPSSDGVLIHLHCEHMEETLKRIEEQKGEILQPKTKIEAERRGYFALFMDCEGNRLGLYSDK